jgi:hypothetical protein
MPIVRAPALQADCTPNGALSKAMVWRGNTDAISRPFSKAAPFIIVAATIPPVNGGRPAIIKFLSIKTGHRK